MKRERDGTYCLLEEAYITLTRNEAEDAWSSRVPEIWKRKTSIIGKEDHRLTC